MPSDSFLDLETVVKLWAWDEYDALANRKQKKLREKEKKKRNNYLNVNIDWSEVEFVDKTLEFPVMDDNTGKREIPKAGEHNTEGKISSVTTVTSGMAGSEKPTTSILFQTKFQNKTDRVQEYTMKTEKTTKSAFYIETESGYTKGFEMSVTLKTPGEIMEASAGYHREYSLTSCTGESFEEELHWGVESMIKVKKNHIAEAQLVVYEKKKKGNFVVNTDISGRVYVSFTNIKDNNSFVMATSDDIYTIIEDYVESERKKGTSFNFITFEDGVVHVKTKGTCGFQYGIRQEVLVDQEPIEGYTDKNQNTAKKQDDDDDDDDDSD